MFASVLSTEVTAQDFLFAHCPFLHLLTLLILSSCNFICDLAHLSDILSRDLIYLSLLALKPALVNSIISEDVFRTSAKKFFALGKYQNISAGKLVTYPRAEFEYICICM